MIGTPQKLFVVLVLMGVALGLTHNVAAEPSTAELAALQDATEDLGSGDFARVSAAVRALADLGTPAARGVLEGLHDDTLRVDEAGRAWLETSAGVEPLGAAQGTPQGSLRAITVNNAVRRALAPALAQLQLASESLETRRQAAEALSNRPLPEAELALRSALESESDPDVRVLLSLALAQLDISSELPERRIAAIAAIREAGDVRFQAALESLLKKNSSGDYLEQSEEVRQAARSALGALESRVFWVSALANSLYGVSLASILVLAAIGLAITFGLMRVINMAHGEMLMLGAYTTFVVQNFFRAQLPGVFDWYLLLAIPSAFVVCGLTGILLERLVVRHLYGRPLETLLATWGLSLMLIQTVRLIFGAQNVAVANPEWLSGGVELLPALVLPYSRIAIIGFTVIVIAAVALLLQKTSFGLQIRAVTQNRPMASSMGIPAARVDALTFGLGSGLAGLAGVALSQLGNVGPELGQGYIVDSFMVVVLGGVGKLVGTVIAATGLGLLNKYVEPVSGAVLGKILILLLVVLFIQKRPQGLFALKGRAAEV